MWIFINQSSMISFFGPKIVDHYDFIHLKSIVNSVKLTKTLSAKNYETKLVKKSAYHTVIYKWKLYDKKFFHRTHAWNCIMSFFCMNLYD